MLSKPLEIAWFLDRLLSNFIASVVSKLGFAVDAICPSLPPPIIASVFPIAELLIPCLTK